MKFVFQNILKRHDARVQSILLCHSYSNLIERMLKRLHERPDRGTSDVKNLKVGDLVTHESRLSVRPSETVYEIRRLLYNGLYVLCEPLSGGNEIEFMARDVQLVLKPAPIEDDRAVQTTREFL